MRTEKGNDNSRKYSQLIKFCALPARRRGLVGRRGVGARGRARTRAGVGRGSAIDP